MSKHTPGPWHVVDRHPAESRYGRHEFEVRTQGGAAITGWGSVTQTKANALLIAAAPKMLAALEIFCELDACNDRSDALAAFDAKYRIGCNEGRYSFLLRIAREAASEAKGQS